MSIIPDELKRQTFPCPYCGQIISTDTRTCRFCEKEIDETLQLSSVHKELRDRSLARLRSHKIYMGAGVLVFCGGIFTLLTPLIEVELGSNVMNFSCWTPFLLIGGLGSTVMGFRRYLREKRYLKNV